MSFPSLSLSCEFQAWQALCCLLFIQHHDYWALLAWSHGDFVFVCGY